jgi:hypothetical protein
VGLVMVDSWAYDNEDLRIIFWVVLEPKLALDVTISVFAAGFFGDNVYIYYY